MSITRGLQKMRTSTELTELQERLAQLRVDQEATGVALANVEYELPVALSSAAEARKLYFDAVSEWGRKHFRSFKSSSLTAINEAEDARLVKEAVELEIQPRIVRANQLENAAGQLRQRLAYINRTIAQLEGEVGEAEQELEAEPDLLARIKARLPRR